jgi:ATP-dependent Clp protease ATP-binding subunit ClpA
MPYSLKLPHKFLIWWAIQAPVKAFNIARTILAVANNEMSFLMNIRLIFVPLYGNKSSVGRVISFVARIFMISLGFLVMLALLVFTLATPLVWLAIPLALSYFVSVEATLLLTLATYIFWTLNNLNVPDTKVKQLYNGKYKKCFRPATLNFLNLTIKHQEAALKNIFDNKEITYLLKKSELNIKELKDKLCLAPKIKCEDLEKKAFDLAKENKSRYVETEHLFTAIIQSIPAVETILSAYNSKTEVIKQAAFWIVEEREYLAKFYIWQDDYEMTPLGGISKGMLGRVTPILDSVSEDLTKAVQKGKVDRIIGREDEIKKISSMLDGTKGNILIIGEPGSGKTSILKGIAYKIICGTEYKTLNNKRIISLDVGSLLSGAGSPGEIADKLKNVMEDAEGSGDIILFLDEIQNLVTGLGETGGDSSIVFAMLEKHLTDDRIRFIGATSIANYRKYIETNETIARLFQTVQINQASKEDTVLILKYVARKYERKYRIVISYPAISKSVELSEKLIHERVLPDKAIDILNRTATTVKEGSKYLTSAEVEKEVAEMTNIPVSSINQNEAKKLLNIEGEMKKMVIGQDKALEKITSALQRARTGIRDEKKPIASFLFVGTTGVGKTQTAKALAKNYFGDEKNMIRLDMSEYQQFDSLSRLIGSPDGSTRGLLTDTIRERPFALLLIDEVEKAHPNILLTFLQVLDEGRLTDSSGTLADFTNTIIIMTSNVGTRSIQEAFEKNATYQEMSEKAMTDVKNKFAPEFLNRFTGIIVFNPLSMTSIQQIANLQLNGVKKMATEKGITITFKPELVQKVVELGYSPEWGARPLARVIEDSIQSYLAVKILENEIKAGDTVSVGLEVFETKK